MGDEVAEKVAAMNIEEKQAPAAAADKPQQTKKQKNKKKDATEGATAEVAERMPFYMKRVELFEKYHAREIAAIEAAKAADEKITVTLPDGNTKEAVKGVTTPMQIAEGISTSLAKKVIVAVVDGEEWDTFRPLEKDCAMKLCTFDDPEGKDTFWHSSAHVLGQALEMEFGVDLCIGPSIEEGFYYDCFMGDRALSESHTKQIENRMSSAVKEKQRFERVVVSRDEALGMFQENKFKVEIISELPQDAVISLYRCGPMVDLCHGPHVPNTGVLKCQAVNSMSRAFWRGDVKKDGLQRVYGVTFPEKALLKDYQHRIAEAKKRDHRVLANTYELFMFHPLSPGSAFFTQFGTRIYNKLVEFMRRKYWEYEYEEVITPNMYNFELWETSGHADHYRENMFAIDVEKQDFGLKPMNCPGHCLMFASRTRSYRELPLRLADFGVLHRNEYSGALHGLTRVRRFQQDDAHIFCREDQIMTEVSNYLKMLSECYDIFGLDYELNLSTRPEGYLGELETWDKAEAALTEALNSTGRPWALNEGDGAFYGPKIDIIVLDALRRKFQCATVQLDFQLPIRFNLEYTTEQSGVTARPVIVHRAILGSVERMFAILTEHFAGNWPLWLSPRQVMIVPISEKQADYAKDLRSKLHREGFHVEVNLSDNKMQKKVREAEILRFNYILVVGEEEKANETVNVRTRGMYTAGVMKLDAFVAAVRAESDSFSKEAAFQNPNPPAEATEGK